MTDQELIARLRLQSEHIPVQTIFDDAADLIEELVKGKGYALERIMELGDRTETLTAKLTKAEEERDELGRKLNTARYGQPDFAWSIHEEAMADLRFKLAKAVEALRSVDDEYSDTKWGPELTSIKQVRDVLAELEGK